MPTHSVKVQLDAWRQAEHRRDRLVPGSGDWDDADHKVRSAATAFHAELAQVSARYREAEFQRSLPVWSRRANPIIERAPQ